MNKKIFSIAPSFNCQLSCEGCYLTTDVTKEMRNATKSEAYYLRAIETAAENGYTDFAITWNPFPGSYEMTKNIYCTPKFGFQHKCNNCVEHPLRRRQRILRELRCSDYLSRRYAI